MKTHCLVSAFLLLSSFSGGAVVKDIHSPDKRIKVHIDIGKGIFYSVAFRGQNLLRPSQVALQIAGMPADLAVKQVTSRAVNEVITSPVPEKRKRIPDVYNEVTIRFRRPFSITFRVYNDGVAWRFSTHAKDSLTIRDETAQFNFTDAYPVYYPEVVKRENADSFHTSFEEPYQHKTLDSLTTNTLCFTPVLVAVPNGPRVAVTESDLEDYPGMFLTGGQHALQGKFAPYPLEEEVTGGEFPQLVVTKRADFLARTAGSRTFPWRVLLIAAQDSELPVNDLVYRLASPSRLQDVSWIGPGKGTDEWIIGINLFNVPFRSGINTATYKYYVDFAKRFGFNRIMMDAGWSDYKDLFKINPALDMEEIAAYAKARNIRLSMWTLAMTLDQQLEPALQQFNKWGADFIMTDFIDRDDQRMVNFTHRIAAACAKHRIMIMFHGAPKPAGFNRTWPHAVTREGVLGSEYNIWSNKATPEHDVLLPFIRMVAGPMDYEPGILDNATEKTFRPIGDKVMSQGTRCHQGAMFIVYDSPMQIFSGNPSQALTAPAFMELLGSIPTVWDTTLVITAALGDYIVTARKKQDEWFVGAMTDWTPRDLTIPLSFLDEGAYEATICEDGINADRYPSDYRMDTLQLVNKDSLRIHLAPGGGYMARFRKRH
ncbi:glycoside hydrolase family 97 protein [uncultured Chitinophaga sp.]|jgi:Glycoside hydrolase 97.|uniref:glycoside hydrolase family 97 protein n=1 Tax=uncultured Chitinophaga sp. TaxID=339340 RepID=UPI00260A45BB|nr:glycoside hydrolase family 97 protein [uncultured Chitinophaga sp.]